MNDTEKQVLHKRLIKTLLVAFIVLVVLLLIYFLAPPCIIKSTFSVECPACGTSRMIDAMLKGQLKEAFLLNPFMFFILPLSSIFAIVEAVKYVIKGRAMNSRFEKIFLVAVLALSIVFAVLRNIFGF